MRSLRAFAVIGSLALAGGLSAQSLAEHAAAAAGATVGTAAGKPISSAISNIFSQTDHATATAAGGKDKAKAPVKPTVIADQKASATKQSGPAPQSGGGGGGALSSAGSAIERSHNARASHSASREHTAVAGTAQLAAPVSISVAIAPPRKDPSIEDLANIKIGATQSELQSALGTPASHVIVPDDDGHLRESCQDWANGRQIGTVRLDYGQVVKVDVLAR